MPLWMRATVMTLLLPGVVAGLIPYQIAQSAWALPFSSSLIPRVGWPLLLLGIAVLLVTIWAFAFSGRGTLAPWDAPTTLVQGGLYQWVRNPMYLGVLAAILGQALLWTSFGVVAYAVMMTMAFHIRVVRFEEPTLLAQFGVPFDAYCRSVPRWIPRRPRPG